MCQIGTSSWGGYRKLPVVFQVIKQLLEPPTEEKRKIIGFRGSNK